MLAHRNSSMAPKNQGVPVEGPDIRRKGRHSDKGLPFQVFRSNLRIHRPRKPGAHRGPAVPLLSVFRCSSIGINRSSVRPTDISPYTEDTQSLDWERERRKHKRCPPHTLCLRRSFHSSLQAIWGLLFHTLFRRSREESDSKWGNGGQCTGYREHIPHKNSHSHLGRIRTVHPQGPNRLECTLRRRLHYCTRIPNRTLRICLRIHQDHIPCPRSQARMPERTC